MAKTLQELQRLLRNIEGREGQHERAQAIKAEIERMKAIDEQ